jgi:hypothetical protein
MASLKTKGDLAELKVAADLVERGYQIALPTARTTTSTSFSYGTISSSACKSSTPALMATSYGCGRSPFP